MNRDQSPEGRPLRLLLVGDLILGEPDPDFFFTATRDTLRAGDLVIGHVEVPHTARGRALEFDVPAEASPPEALHALARAGFHVATLAGNHVFDFGADGIADTREALRAAGIAACGAGADLRAAEQPAIVARGGLRVGVLSFNCVGPAAAWAGEDKAGCAYVRVLGPDGACVGPSPREVRASRLDCDSVRAAQRQVEALRRDVDVLIVSLHQGIVHMPAELAPYERPLARALVEAGASLIVGHHAHILRGVELVGDAPVFYGLGNFVTVTRALSLDNAHPARRAWAERRRTLFGFEPDPAYPTFPFHPEAKHALIADCRVDARGAVQAGFLPCWIEPSGRPVRVGPDDPRGRAVVDYVADISARAGLSVQLAWDGERVVVR